MTTALVIPTRNEFDRHRNCAHCGQALRYAQITIGLAQTMTKRCPLFDRDPSRHDFLEYVHTFPYRDRRGHASDGTKNLRHQETSV